MPSILLATVLSDCIELAYCGILTLTIALLFYQSKQAGDKRYAGLSTSNLWNVALTGKRPFITCFRSYVLIATAVCILAVDFTAFPRRFGKVETYGTGFMDAGVGAFVMSNAIVSSEARGRYPKHRYLKMNGKARCVRVQDVVGIPVLFWKHIFRSCVFNNCFNLFHFRGFTDRMSSIMKSFRSCIPLLVIGAARTVSVKATDYQEHVSEYGVHWNFFFTLAAVKVCHLFASFSHIAQASQPGRKVWTIWKIPDDESHCAFHLPLFAGAFHHHFVFVGPKLELADQHCRGVWTSVPIARKRIETLHSSRPGRTRQQK